MKESLASKALGAVRKAVSTASSETPPADSAADKVRNLRNVPHPSPATKNAAGAELAKRGFSIPKEVRRRVKEFAAEWERLYALELENSPTALHAAWQAHVQALAQQTANGKNITDENAWTREDFMEDGAIKRGIFRTQRKALEQKTWELLRPHFAAYADALDVLADDLEKDSRAEFARWAIPYTPPPYVIAIRKLADTARGDLSDTPSVILGNLPECLK